MFVVCLLNRDAWCLETDLCSPTVSRQELRRCSEDSVHIVWAGINWTKCRNPLVCFKSHCGRCQTQQSLSSGVCLTRRCKLAIRDTIFALEPPVIAPACKHAPPFSHKSTGNVATNTHAHKLKEFRECCGLYNFFPTLRLKKVENISRDRLRAEFGTPNLNCFCRFSQPSKIAAYLFTGPISSIMECN